jgi:hypothetical protein
LKGSISFQLFFEGVVVEFAAVSVDLTDPGFDESM